MKIGKAISIELRDGQRLTLSLKETKELYTKLESILSTSRIGTRGNGEKKKVRGKKKSVRKSKGRSAKPSHSRLIVTLSDAKKQEVLKHLNNEISQTPRTLTNLLKGVSYSASQIPAIRTLIEGEQNIKAKAKGKRTLYQIREKISKKRTTTTAAAAAKAKAEPEPEKESKTPESAAAA